MNKNIVIELDEDGFITSVWCPDDTYVVDVLDRSDKNSPKEVLNYYAAVESELLPKLKNCY